MPNAGAGRPIAATVGDIYNPGHGRRLQIRNNHRQIIGYVEADGTVTNTRRQKIGTIADNR